jgi:FemAB-related protein (PEP-CTERM system-associated)
LLFGHALVSTPFCVYGGIVAADPEARQALEARACELARQRGVDYMEMRNTQRSHPDWPVKDLYFTFRRPILPDSEKNMLAIPRKQRAMVRKGIQNNLQVKMDSGVDDIYRMYSESLRNLGTPAFSKKYLRLLCDIFGSDAEILTVCHDDAPVSSVLSFRFRGEILPYYGGGIGAARGLAANDFMYWRVMERAREQDLRIFDFGRSKRGTGAFDFKCHWGFEPQPLYYEYYLVKARRMPNLSPANPKYSTGIRLWRRLPVGLANFLGRFVAPYLG